MKHFNKALVAASLAALSFTSCVDNEVTPEVKQLREAQAAYITAQADLQAAEAQAKLIAAEAGAAFTLAQAALQNATADNMAATAKSAMAAADVAVANAQLALAQSELQIEQAVAALERTIANEASAAQQEILQGHLDNYRNEMAAVYGGTTSEDVSGLRVETRNTGLMSIKVDLQGDIAQAKLMLTALTSGDGSQKVTWDYQLAQLQENVAKAEADLAAEEEALSSLETVVANPSAAQAELETLKKEIAALVDEANLLAVNLEKANQVLTPLTTAAATPKADSTAYETAVTEIADFWADGSFAADTVEAAILKNRVDTYEAAVADYQKDINDAADELKAAESAEVEARVAYNIGQNEFEFRMEETDKVLDPFDNSATDGTPAWPNAGARVIDFAVDFMFDADGDNFEENYFYDLSDDVNDYALSEFAGATAARKKVMDMIAEYTATINSTDAAVTPEEKTVAQANKTNAEGQLALWNKAANYTAYKTAFDTYKVEFDKIEASKEGVKTSIEALERHQSDLLRVQNAYVTFYNTNIGPKKDGGSASIDQSGKIEITTPEVADAGTLADLEAIKADKQTAYDAALVKLAELAPKIAEAQKAVDAIEKAQGEITPMGKNKQAVVTVLEAFLKVTETSGGNSLEGIKKAIELKLVDIESSKDAIAVAQASIASGTYNKAQDEAEITEMEAELARLDAQIEVHLELAAKYKALLDAALAVN